MPLFADGLKKIQKALLLVEARNPSPLVKVGAFTAVQLKLINGLRIEDELEPIEGVIIFNGKHLHASRCGIPKWCDMEQLPCHGLFRLRFAVFCVKGIIVPLSN